MRLDTGTDLTVSIIRHVAEAVDALGDPSAAAEALRHVLVGGTPSVEAFAREVEDATGGDVIPPHAAGDGCALGIVLVIGGHQLGPLDDAGDDGLERSDPPGSPLLLSRNEPQEALIVERVPAGELCLRVCVDVSTEQRPASGNPHLRVTQ